MLPRSPMPRSPELSPRDHDVAERVTAAYGVRASTATAICRRPLSTGQTHWPQVHEDFRLPHSRGDQWIALHTPDSRLGDPMGSSGSSWRAASALSQQRAASAVSMPRLDTAPHGTSNVALSQQRATSAVSMPRLDTAPHGTSNGLSLAELKQMLQPAQISEQVVESDEDFFDEDQEHDADHPHRFRRRRTRRPDDAHTYQGLRRNLANQAAEVIARRPPKPEDIFADEKPIQPHVSLQSVVKAPKKKTPKKNVVLEENTIGLSEQEKAVRRLRRLLWDDPQYVARKMGELRLGRAMSHADERNRSMEKVYENTVYYTQYARELKEKLKKKRELEQNQRAKEPLYGRQASSEEQHADKMSKAQTVLGKWVFKVANKKEGSGEAQDQTPEAKTQAMPAQRQISKPKASFKPSMSNRETTVRGRETVMKNRITQVPMRETQVVKAQNVLTKWVSKVAMKGIPAAPAGPAGPIARSPMPSPRNSPREQKRNFSKTGTSPTPLRQTRLTQSPGFQKSGTEKPSSPGHSPARQTRITVSREKPPSPLRKTRSNQSPVSTPPQPARVPAGRIQVDNAAARKTTPPGQRQVDNSRVRTPSPVRKTTPPGQRQVDNSRVGSPPGRPRVTIDVENSTKSEADNTKVQTSTQQTSTPKPHFTRKLQKGASKVKFQDAEDED